MQQRNYTEIEIDVLELGFIEKYIVDKDDEFEGFDLVFSNPAFEKGYAAIYVGLELLKKRDNKNGALIYLLPEAYFEF